MPQSLPLAAFVLGAVLLLLAITTGGVRIFGAEMSGASGRWSRAVAGLVGAGLIVFALWPNLIAFGSFGTATEGQGKASLPGPASVHAAASTDPSPGAAATSTPPPQKRVVMGPLEVSTNRQGDDFDAFGKPADNAQLCAEMCRVDADCRAMSYVISRKTCWLKTAAPPATLNVDIISSVKAAN